MFLGLLKYETQSGIENLESPDDTIPWQIELEKFLPQYNVQNNHWKQNKLGELTFNITMNPLATATFLEKELTVTQTLVGSNALNEEIELQIEHAEP